MAEKLDKLGRRIPQFDRSAVGRRNAKNMKEQYGPDYFSKLSRAADHSRNRGYFGKLKDEGRIEELRKVAHKGQSKAYAHFNRLKDEGKTEELKTYQKKSAKVRKAKDVSSRRNKPVSGA